MAWSGELTNNMGSLSRPRTYYGVLRRYEYEVHTVPSSLLLVQTVLAPSSIYAETLLAVLSGSHIALTALRRYYSLTTRLPVPS